jgi:hypothetical protein
VDDRSGSRLPNIADGLRRLLDQRTEQRGEFAPQTAVMNHQGHRHVVRVANLSPSGAMILFSGDLQEGDSVELQLLDHGSMTGQVRWLRDGRIGVSFDDPANEDDRSE